MLDKLEGEDREVVDAALERAERTEAELRYLADHDSLTGLLDRRRFRAELDQFVSFSARYGGQGAVMIIDIDGLKLVNDALGHQAGDNLIRQVAAIMRERVRATDIVARLSGDEFAVLMPQTDVERGDDSWPRTCVTRSRRTRGRRRMRSAVTISVGSRCSAANRAAAPRASWSPPTRRCTRRRRRGATGSRCSATRARRSAPPERIQTTTARIRDALTHDRLCLHTQPIRSLAAGGIERYELLLRMTGEDGSCCRPPPSSRRPSARGWSRSSTAGSWRARSSCSPRASARASRSRSTSTSPASRSPTSRSSSSSNARLDEGGADPSRCTFEITEDAPVEDYDTAIGFADRLTELGCQVAIDDYGASFGPFHHLKNLPFDLIKIDGEFVRDMPRSDADQLTVQAIVQIAQGLGKETIAEFVQDDTTAEMLRDYGVDMAQGFHLGRPVDIAEALAA